MGREALCLALQSLRELSQLLDELSQRYSWRAERLSPHLGGEAARALEALREASERLARLSRELRAAADSFDVECRGVRGGV